MGINQIIRDTQLGRQPELGAEALALPQSVIAAAKAINLPETDVLKVLERVGASCQIEQVLANGPAGRSVIVRVDSGSEIAWHRHTNASNVYFCLEGSVVVETKRPDGRAELVAGQTHTVPPNTFHRVVGGGNSRVVVVYKDGPFDVRMTG
jgi:quercetin dioxygenase-like cupin family protein